MAKTIESIRMSIDRMMKEKEDLQSDYYEANIEYNGLVAKKYKLVSKSKHIAA